MLGYGEMGETASEELGLIMTVRWSQLIVACAWFVKRDIKIASFGFYR